MNSILQEVNDYKNKFDNESIERLTNKILVCYGSHEYPIPIVEIVKTFGFKVILQKLDPNISGIIGVDNNLKKIFDTNKVISLQEDDNIGHKKFTIAHELCHYLLDYDKNSDIPFYDAYDLLCETNKYEKRANLFAANLLMPKNQFSEMYKDFTKKKVSNTITILANFFEVSETAVRRRIGELHL